MTPEELKAYEWAINQNFQSVAASYARTLARFIQNSDTIPRATVAAALRELRASIAAERRMLFAFVLDEIDATIAKLGLEEQ